MRVIVFPDLAGLRCELCLRAKADCDSKLCVDCEEAVARLASISADSLVRRRESEEATVRTKHQTVLARAYLPPFVF